MGLEQRGQHEYYYRKRRVGGRVVSEYVGSGTFADRCAQWDARQRDTARAARLREQDALTAEKDVDAAVDETGDLITAMAEGSLLVHGYHVHHGEWRQDRSS